MPAVSQLRQVIVAGFRGSVPVSCQCQACAWEKRVLVHSLARWPFEVISIWRTHNRAGIRTLKPTVPTDTAIISATSGAIPGEVTGFECMLAMSFEKMTATCSAGIYGIPRSPQSEAQGIP
jgi:hypothetical protein